MKNLKWQSEAFVFNWVGNRNLVTIFGHGHDYAFLYGLLCEANKVT